MHAVLAFQVAVSIVAFELHRYRLDAGLVGFQQVGDGEFIFMVFGVTHIHAHEHLCPVLGLGAARARVDFQHSAHRVGLLAQHVLEFEVLHDLDSGVVLLVHFLLGGFAFLGEVEEYGKVVAGVLGFLVAIKPAFHLTHFLHSELGSLGVGPKLRVLRFFV